jgi:hypothetical protein
MKTMKKPLIGTLLATAVASAILAAPVGAAKPTDSITCTAGGLTTLTWISGTTSAVVTWQDGDGSLVGQALVTVITHGPDSLVVGDTPANAATASVTFSGRKPVELPPATCTPT